MTVTKNALMLRDNDGELLPATVHSDLFGGEVKLKRLTDGDINEITEKAKNKQDNEMLLNFVIEPVMGLEDIKEMPSIAKRELMILIMMTAGMPRDKVENILNSAASDDKKKLTGK